MMIATPETNRHERSRHPFTTATYLATTVALLGVSGSSLAQSNLDQNTNARERQTVEADALQPAVYSNYTNIIDDETIAAADRLSEAFRRVADLVEPSVVRISGFNARGQVTGSGFVINPRGYLVTNHHVIEEADRIYAEFVDGRRFRANVVGADPLTDLAVVSIDADDLDALRFTDGSKQLQVGDWVVAAGCPLGLQQTVTAGIVSAVGRQLGIIANGGRAGYEDFIQTDAAINRGNSGGPLLNLRGEVIGVNSAILTETGGSDGLGFAIPASLAGEIVNDLVRDGEVKRGLLGVNIQDLTPELCVSYGLPGDQVGVLITGLDDKLPAGRVGLAMEDVIVAIDGKQVTDAENLRKVVAMEKPGSTVKVDVLRNRQAVSYNVVLASLDETYNPPRVQTRRGGNIGLGFEVSNARTERRGEVVAYVERLLPGSIADLAGFELRDIIVEVNGTPIDQLATRANKTPAEYVDDLLSDAASGSVLRFKVRRPTRSGSMTNFVGLRIP